MILVSIAPPNVKYLIMNSKFTFIMLQLHYSIQVRLPMAKLKRSRTF